MKWIFFAMCFGLLALSGAPKNEINTPAFDFSGQTTDGKSIRLSDYKGKVVLLDFWASWCAPCEQAFPFLVKLHDKLRDTNFTVLSINIDIEKRKMQEFLAKQKTPAQFPIIYDNEATLPRLYDVDGMPTTVLIDRDGIIRYRHSGFSGKTPKLIVDEVITLLRK